MKRLFNLMLVATIGATSIATVNAKPMPSNAIPTTAKIQFNNQPVQEANGFVVDGYTYVRGRDLADICNFTFVYDLNTKEVVTSNSSETSYFSQERLDNEIGAYQYNNENYLQIRKIMGYALYRPEISYDNSTKVITLTEELTLGREKKPITQEEYMADTYPNGYVNTTPHMPTSDSNNSGTNTNSNTNNNTTGTSTISNEITAQDIKDYNDELLRLVNEARVEAGVKPLTLNQELIEIATAKANEMVELNYFSHTSPTYGDFRQFAVAVAGEKYSNKGMGENITKQGIGQKSYLYKNNVTDNYGKFVAEVTFSSWWNSQGHKDNILNSKYTEMGASIQLKERESNNSIANDVTAVQMFIY